MTLKMDYFSQAQNRNYMMAESSFILTFLEKYYFFPIKITVIYHPKASIKGHLKCVVGEKGVKEEGIKDQERYGIKMMDH